MSTTTTEAPVTEQEPSAAKTHSEESKSFFNEAMKAEGAVPQSKDPVAHPPVTDPAIVSDPADASAIPSITSKVPGDLLDPAVASTETGPDASAADALAEIEAMTLPKNAKPEQVASFGKLKEAAKKSVAAAHARVAELEKKTSGKSATPAEIESAQARAKAAEDKAAQIEEEFARAAYESSPRFKAQFVEAEKAALDGAKTYLEGTEITPDTIDLAARASGQKRLQILRDAGADPEMIAAIVPQLSQFDSVQRGKAKALENWRTEAARNQEADSARDQAAKAKRAEQENRVWDDTLSKANLLPFRKSKEADAQEWNARADNDMAKAKQIFNGENVGLDEMAATIQKGVAYDAQQEVLDDLVERVKLLTTENAKLKSARPGGSSTVNGTSATTATGSDASPSSIFNAELQKARA